MQTFDVAIVGAGLAGLRAAQVLERAGREVIVIDRNPEVGGRLASRNIDGYIVDEGFQLVNPSYPELRATEVLGSLDLRTFNASLLVTKNGKQQLYSDPRQTFLRALSPLVKGGLSISDSWAFAKLALHCGVGPIDKVFCQLDESTRTGFEHSGLSPRAMDEIIRPFLRGTLLDDKLESSWHLTQLLLRSFFRGRPGTFAKGVVALPQGMARKLTTSQVNLNENVVAIGASRVVTQKDEYLARAVLVATDATDAKQLGAINSVEWRSQTTWWIAGPKLGATPTLHIDLDEPLLTSALDMSSAVPERSPKGTSLIAAPAIGMLVDASLDKRVLESVAKMFNVATSDLSIIERTVVERALPVTLPPLRLNRSQRSGAVILAGDYVQTPSIQGALVSGRRAAQLILDTP
jgi:hypothetical protein